MVSHIMSRHGRETGEKHTIRNTSTSAGKTLWMVDVTTMYRETPVSELSFWAVGGIF